MAAIKKFFSGALVLGGLIALGLFILAVVNQSHDMIQEVRNDEVMATISNHYVSAQPFTDPVVDVKAGQQIFFNVHVKRPDSGCFINTGWRFALKMGEGQVVVWQEAGALVYAGPTPGENVSQALYVPKDAIPGDYVLTRVTSWQCGNVAAPAMNVLSVNLTVR